MASMCANVLIEAHSGGIQWAQLVEILDTEAAEAAETARWYHRNVGRMMGQITVTLLMGVAVVALTGLLADTAGAWLASGDGQTGPLGQCRCRTGAVCTRGCWAGPKGSSNEPPRWPCRGCAARRCCC